MRQECYVRPDTIQRLNELNRHFYAEHALSFDDTRQRSWPGFAQVLDRCRWLGIRDPSVLDLGCGNGRFGQYLLERWPEPLRYVGIDQSAQLLGQARTRLSPWPQVTLHRRDLVEGRLWERDRYDVVVAFGLMHHLPGFTTRQRVLQHAVDVLAPAGVLAVTFWQFARQERFQRKMVPWPELARHVDRRVDEADLEAGDHLLRWGAKGDAVRYCHHASQREMERLVDGTSGRVVDRFCTDGSRGDLNRYLILERK